MGWFLRGLQAGIAAVATALAEPLLRLARRYALAPDVAKSVDLNVATPDRSDLNFW
ncbi:MAG: hypothetical protein HY060_16240 [Proteobacteria bacterium]|nr:hypothetical protein [Pseudomonadota bacterium]